MVPVYRRHLSFSVLSTFVLAVSTGVNVLVFTIVNALWIRPLPFPEPERMLTIPGSITFGPRDLSLPAFQIFGGGVAGQVVGNEAFEASRRLPQIDLDGRGLETLSVTSGYFRVLRLTIRGRDFSDEDEREGAEPVAIISDQLWDRAFARQPEIVGAVVRSTPIPVRIIGIAPPGFTGARRGELTDIWIPISVGQRAAPEDVARTLLVLARLGPGQTFTEVSERFLALYDPRLFRSFQTALTPLDSVFGTPDTATFVMREGKGLLLAAGLAMLVLLSGCATIAALVLMHYERRRSELALKIALGAGRRRLVLELMRELAMVAAIGGVASMVIAVVGVRLVGALNLPGGVEIGRLDLTIDWRVLAIATVATSLTLLAAVSVPIARTTRLRLAGELLAGPSGATLGSLRVRQTLLTFQVCMSIIILIVAGLFVRAVNHSLGRGAGFDIDRTLFVSVPSKPTPERDLQRLRTMQTERSERLRDVLRTVPGVNDLAHGFAPIGPDALRAGRRASTAKVANREFSLWIDRLAGSPELLSVLGVPMVTGRSLAAADAFGIPVPAVITQSLAARLWPDGGAVGETFHLVELRGGPYQVIGICRDFPFGSLTRPGDGTIVTARSGGFETKLAIRTDSPATVAAMVRRTINQAGVRVASGEELVARDIGRQRLGAWVFSGFGFAALLLGVGGTFGLVAYLAESRRREFGVRLALGASLRDLVRHGLIASMTPVSVGVAAGLGLGAVISQTFKALLAGISTLDAVTYIGVAVTMLGSAMLAGLAAAWRLRQTTPSDALRAS